MCRCSLNEISTESFHRIPDLPPQYPHLVVDLGVGFGFRRDEWMILDEPSPDSSLVYAYGVNCNNTLYFLEQNFRFIWCFNLTDHIFSTLYFLKLDTNEFDKIMAKLTRLDSRLCIRISYYRLHFFRKAEVWVRNEASWFRLSEILRDDVHAYDADAYEAYPYDSDDADTYDAYAYNTEIYDADAHDALMPITLSQDKTRVLLVLEGFKYAWYGLLDNKLQSVTTSGLEHIDVTACYLRNPMLYTPSLIFLGERVDKRVEKTMRMEKKGKGRKPTYNQLREMEEIAQKEEVEVDVDDAQVVVNVSGGHVVGDAQLVTEAGTRQNTQVHIADLQDGQGAAASVQAGPVVDGGQASQAPASLDKPLPKGKTRPPKNTEKEKVAVQPDEATTFVESLVSASNDKVVPEGGTDDKVAQPAKKAGFLSSGFNLKL